MSYVFIMKQCFKVLCKIKIENLKISFEIFLAADIQESLKRQFLLFRGSITKMTYPFMFRGRNGDPEREVIWLKLHSLGWEGNGKSKAFL